MPTDNSTGEREEWGERERQADGDGELAGRMIQTDGGQTNEAWRGAIQTNKIGETEGKTAIRRLCNNLNGKRI